MFVTLYVFSVTFDKCNAFNSSKVIEIGKLQPSEYATTAL